MTVVLLTGATGLIGSRVLPRLATSEFSCSALVRRDLELPPGTTAVRGDLEEPDSLQAAVEDVDAVVHLAALFRTDDQDAIWRANLDGTRNLIEAVRTHSPHARFIMASTGNVYDTDRARPALETDTCSPTLAYPASKVAAENLLRESGLTWSILRLPFVYGDGDGHLASLGALADRFGRHPALTYSVAHHRDVAAVIQLALTGALDRRTVNVTDDAPVTVYEMADFGGNPIAASAEPLTDPWSGRMDGTLLRGFGFRPTVPTIHAAAHDGIL